MARARKRQVQLEMLVPKKRTRRRNGPPLGRPPRGPRSSSPHQVRPAFKARYPVHVVARVLPAIGSLRRRDAYRAVREATIVAAAREDFRIVHISIQRTHVHLIVEADGRVALSRGMQGFQISAAKHLNRAVSKGASERRRGQVFADRYHAEVITTPRQARNALAYVLNNWRKHREDATRAWNVDPFSSGVLFMGWKELEHADVLWKWRETYDPMIVWLPKTWLLSDGWRRYGLIGTREVPSLPR